MKKTRGQKSRVRVPLSLLYIEQERSRQSIVDHMDDLICITFIRHGKFVTLKTVTKRYNFEHKSDNKKRLKAIAL
jgi:hypothetical protein